MPGLLAESLALHSVTLAIVLVFRAFYPELWPTGPDGGMFLTSAGLSLLAYIAMLVISMEQRRRRKDDDCFMWWLFVHSIVTTSATYVAALAGLACNSYKFETILGVLGAAVVFLQIAAIRVECPEDNDEEEEEVEEDGEGDGDEEEEEEESDEESHDDNKNDDGDTSDSSDDERDDGAGEPRNRTQRRSHIRNGVIYPARTCR
jgi:hypothetical protein